MPKGTYIIGRYPHGVYRSTDDTPRCSYLEVTTEHHPKCGAFFILIERKRLVKYRHMLSHGL